MKGLDRLSGFSTIQQERWEDKGSRTKHNIRDHPRISRRRKIPLNEHLAKYRLQFVFLLFFLMTFGRGSTVEKGGLCSLSMSIPSTERRVARVPYIATGESASRSACDLDAVIVGVPKAADLNTSTGSRTSSMRRVAAQHRNT